MDIKKLISLVLIAFIVVSVAYALFMKKGNTEVGENDNPGSEIASIDEISIPETGSEISQPDSQLVDPESGVPYVYHADNLQPDRLRVYYFHRTMRCTGCTNVEQASFEAISVNHSEEVENGLIEWQSINFQLPEYEHFADEFGLYSQALMFFKIEDGIVTRYEPIQDVWEHSFSKPDALELVSNEIDQWLEEISG